MATETPASSIMMKKEIINRIQSIFPARIAFIPNTTFTTGILAVIKLREIPGIIPITAIIIKTIFKGVMILCASLNDFALIDIGIITPANKTTNGKRRNNNKIIDCGVNIP